MGTQIEYNFLNVVSGSIYTVLGSTLTARVLTANPQRKRFDLINLGANPVIYNYGATANGSTSLVDTLNACGSALDGLGGKITEFNWTGDVSVFTLTGSCNLKVLDWK